MALVLLQKNVSVFDSASCGEIPLVLGYTNILS